MILLDTTFLIDLLRKRENAIKKAVELSGKNRLATTYVNIYELLLGVYSVEGIDYEKKLQDAERLLEKLEILILEKQSAIISAKIGGALSLEGQMIGDVDNMIAGIALANNISTIVTRDKEHFQRIKGIRVEGY